MTQKMPESTPSGVVKNIVVVRLYGLGNFILALPLIEALPQLYPKARITLLVDSRCRKIARLTRPRSRIVVIDEQFDVRSWFAEEKPDLCLMTYPCADVELVKAATEHSGQCVVHRVGANSGIASLELAADADRHEAELNLDLVRALGRKVKLSFPHLTLTAKALSQAGQLIRKHKLPEAYIVFHPGCFGDLALKRWPPAYYGELAGRLYADGYGIVLVGGSDEVGLAGPIIDSASVPIVDLIGKTTLPQVAGLLRNARLIVANDTGLMHLAAAVGTHVVGIYGPTSHMKNTPLIGQHHIVRRPVSCSPCYQPGKPVPICRAWCLEMTTPDQVYQACLKLIQGKLFQNKKRYQPFVSVIVPTFNSEKKIGLLLKSLAQQSYPEEKFEIIVVDNNSSDGTKQEILKYPRVKYAFYDKRQTSYAARNHGIIKARGDVLAFTDDDCVAEPDWIANGVQWFEHPEVGGVAGKVVGAQSDNDIARWQSRRGFLDLHPDIETSKRPSIVTANVFYRREVFDRVGAFQGKMVSSGDQEMAWRVIQDGRYVFRAANDAIVHHHHRETLASLAKTFFRYGYGHVDLDRRFAFDDHSASKRLVDGAQTWKSLITQGIGFATKGYSHNAVLGMRDEHPDDFIERCSRFKKGTILTAIGLDDSSILRLAGENGIEIISLPLPPSVEYLDAALQVIVKDSHPQLFFYAAGQHTRRLMSRPDFARLSILGVIDDQAGPDQKMGQLPVVTLDEALHRCCQTILISTDAFEDVLLKKLAYLKAQGIHILGLYDTKAFERLARNETSNLLDVPAEQKALFILQSRLSDTLAAAVAKGAGIQIRLDERSSSRYSDPFLDWVITVAKRSGRIVGSIRYRHLYV